MKTRAIRGTLVFTIVGFWCAAPAYPEQNPPQSAAQQKAEPVQQKAGAAQQKSAPTQPESNSDALEKVFKQMDEAAKEFRSVQADFVWKMYNSVVNDFAEIDTGKIYFRRAGNEIQMAAEIKVQQNTDAPTGGNAKDKSKGKSKDKAPQPATKKVVFSGGKIEVAKPDGEIDVYDASAHREEFEAFLVLGFGSSPEEIRKLFEIKYVGEEKIGTLETAKLELTPIAQKVKDRFPRIDLWIDPQRGLSVRQQLFQPDGDYRLADYSNFKNQRISDNVFKMKQSENTRIINH